MPAMPPTDPLRIVPADPADLAAINALIARSKAYWPWPADYLAQALPLHVLTPAYLAENLCFDLLAPDGTRLGFCSVTREGERRVLDNLFIDPPAIGAGHGRVACERLFGLARREGWPALFVVPDPPAEGFYLRLGFRDTGERVPSRIPGGPVFSVLAIEFR